MKKTLPLLLILLLGLACQAQEYLHKTEAFIRSQVPYEINSFIDKTGSKVIYWEDERSGCRYLNYISNPTQKVFATIIMIKERNMEIWLDWLNQNYRAISNSKWTTKERSDIIISLTKDFDNGGWNLFITDSEGLKTD